MGLIILNRPSSGGTGEVDIGTNPSQIPTNAITETKLNTKLATFPILSKSVGEADAQLTDNARVISLINTSLTPVEETLVTLEQTINNYEPTTAIKLSYKATSAESLEEGMYICVYRDGTTTKCIRANAASGQMANGYVEANYDVGVEVTYYKDGTINEKGNDLIAGKIWLSNVTPGRAMIASPAARSGHYSQQLGESVGVNKHSVNFGLVVKLL